MLKYSPLVFLSLELQIYPLRCPILKINTFKLELIMSLHSQIGYILTIPQVYLFISTPTARTLAPDAIIS